ncbi:hypothetical protein KKA47_05635 [bacterium]|nr:hypothetical protein [bacterium]
MPKLFRAHTLLAFRLYLIFLGEDKGTYSAIPIDEKKWGIKLGFSLKKARKNLSKNYKRYFYKRRLKGLLEILRNKYKIIRIDRDADVVSRMRLPQSTMKISIPDTFWEHGWYLRLSLPAIYFYFISLLELQNSPFYPWWSLSLKKVGRRYRCVPTVLANGVRELADYNILEILKDIPVKRGNRYTQEAGYYRLNPFYDVKGFEKDILKLQKKFSKRVVRLSREFAAILYASHNLETLHFICGLIKSRGERKVREAFKIISKTKISSSKRRLDYLMILMEREG